MSSGTLAQQVARQIEWFLAGAPHAVAIEEGAVVFDFATAKYSVSPERDKCVLQIWSEERNVVRRVIGTELKNDILKLTVSRFGQTKPSKLEICRDADRRTPSAKKGMRAGYQRTLQRVLDRAFPGWTLEKLSTAADLERSFGPVHVRGAMRHGQSYFAVVGVNAQESQASVDAALTTGILWLDHLRERLAIRGYVEGLRLIVPHGRSAVVRMRMAHLHREMAKWELFELDERAETLEAVDSADTGNISTRLLRCADESIARERFAGSIAKIRALVPLVEEVVISAGEIAFRLHGLEFARVRIAADVGSFKLGEQISFGTGAAEIAVSDATEEMFNDFVAHVNASREGDNGRSDALYRACPERWLESIVKRDVTTLDERLDGAHVYWQVPAFAASDRAMIDVLTSTRDGRLAVVELKANEDLHLPLQGLDYWARVKWHQERGEFQKFGYFAGQELSTAAPLLIMVAPSLHVHPTTDALLRYLSPEIEWKLVGIDERWRDGVRVLFRKSRGARSVVVTAG
jgi:hypothetical protein